MKTIEEIRRLRLDALRDELGSWVAINGLMGYSARDSTLSQVSNASVNKKTGVPKSMGSDVARQLEAACKKPTGWMDNDPAFDAHSAAIDVDIAEMVEIARQVDPEERRRMKRMLRALLENNEPL
jgi:hypothetical protein